MTRTCVCLAELPQKKPAGTDDDGGVQQASRFDLARALRPRYAHASRDEKGQLLDEFCELTGYTRNHALVLLGCPPPGDRPAALPWSTTVVLAS